MINSKTVFATIYVLLFVCATTLFGAEDDTRVADLERTVNGGADSKTGRTISGLVNDVSTLKKDIQDPANNRKGLAPELRAIQEQLRNPTDATRGLVPELKMLQNQIQDPNDPKKGIAPKLKSLEDTVGTPGSVRLSREVRQPVKTLVTV